jgi:predicted N-formylglutamate amidohydrolase
VNTPAPCYRIPGDQRTGVLLLADHASNYVPDEFQQLGLPQAQFERHIGYDIGIAWVTRRLAESLQATAVLSHFSRLLIDPNRGADDPTLVMRIADGALIPGNATIDAKGIMDRTRRFHQPYHDAIRQELDSMLAGGIAPVIISLHSFTPVLRGRARPWHIGILWDADPRLPVPLLQSLGTDPDWVIGDNEPYDGALAGDTLDQHATMRGLANALIEIRQDLIATEADAVAVADRLVPHLKAALAAPHLFEQQQHQTRSRDRIRHL